MLTETYRPLTLDAFVGLPGQCSSFGVFPGKLGDRCFSWSLPLYVSSHPLTIGVSGQSVHGADGPNSFRTGPNWTDGCSRDSRLYGGQLRRAVSAFRAFLPSRADVPAQILHCSRGDVLGSSPLRNRSCRDSNHDGMRGLIPPSGKQTSDCVESLLQPSGSKPPCESSREFRQPQPHTSPQPSVVELRPGLAVSGLPFGDHGFCNGHIFLLATQPPPCTIDALSYEGWLEVNLRAGLMAVESLLLERGNM